MLTVGRDYLGIQLPTPLLLLLWLPIYMQWSSDSAQSAQIDTGSHLPRPTAPYPPPPPPKHRGGGYVQLGFTSSSSPPPPPPPPPPLAHIPLLPLHIDVPLQLLTPPWSYKGGGGGGGP